MTGTTAHVLQGLGWLPSTPTGFALPLWANRWLGLYATYEGLALQLAALLAVIGSYVVARELQVKAPRRRRARAATYRLSAANAARSSKCMKSFGFGSGRSATSSRPPRASRRASGAAG